MIIDNRYIFNVTVEIIGICSRPKDIIMLNKPIKHSFVRQKLFLFIGYFDGVY